jgi:glycosyltransferase involved in cell wall biosynthesis
MITIYIINHNIVISPTDIKGSIEERYWIYKDLIDFALRKAHSRIFWFVARNKLSLHIFDKQSFAIISNYNIIKYLTLLIKDAIKGNDPVVIIIAYPYALEGLNKLDKMLLLLVLTFLNVISLVKKNIIIVTDDIDPPVEIAISDSIRPLSLLNHAILRVCDFLFLKNSTMIIVLSESYRNYISRLYRIPTEKIVIIPPPALCKFIPYSPPKTKGPLTVLYSGVVKKERNIEPIIQAIDELRNEGYEITLMITSPLILMSLPKHVNCHNYPWPEYVHKALSVADIAVIPYPHDKIHYSYTLVAKLFDYLAAGKPVITTPLYETLKVLKKCGCGFVFTDKESLKSILKFIYRNRYILIPMSERGRQIVESIFRNDILVLKLLREIVKVINSRSRRQ